MIRLGRIAVQAAWALLIALMATHAQAKPDAMAATGSRAARDEATRAIPWKSLAAGEQRAVQHIVRNATIYRRLPTRIIDCDPSVFNFLGQNPEVVTELWKMMGVCNLELEPIGPGAYRATDATGTSGTMKYLASTWQDDANNCALIYCEGTYKGAPLPRPVTARSVLLLRSASTVETNGRPYVTARLDSFIVVDRLGAELLAKTIQPLLVRTADHNFIETMKFVGTFSQTAEKNPAGMQRLSQKLEKLASPTRDTMAEVCSATAARYHAISSVRQGGKVRLVSEQR